MTRWVIVVLSACLIAVSVEMYLLSQKLALYKDTVGLQFSELKSITYSYNECVERVQKCEPLWGAADKDVFCHDGKCMLLDNQRYVPEPKELR